MVINRSYFCSWYLDWTFYINVLQTGCFRGCKELGFSRQLPGIEKLLWLSCGEGIKRPFYDMGRMQATHITFHLPVMMTNHPIFFYEGQGKKVGSDDQINLTDLAYSKRPFTKMAKFLTMSSNNVFQSWVLDYINTLFVDFEGTDLTRACLWATVLGWRYHCIH